MKLKAYYLTQTTQRTQKAAVLRSRLAAVPSGCSPEGIRAIAMYASVKSAESV